ncbi:hypothetical protein R3P38DRAFT_2788021 [Favolaschia claudopus]|uniref:Uncharacterized protein n=1 Tax=Favolaschia claudopus TaxID=2862362 RepID=A0AAW0AMF4_9AGAR
MSSAIHLQLFAAQCTGLSTHPCTPPPASSSERRTLRERCGWDLTISFAPAPTPVVAKGNLGPTINNLPRRKRSSVVSIDLPPRAASPPLAPVGGNGEFFV